MKNSISALIVALAALPASAAFASDFRSVGAEPAVMYDAPSDRGRRVFIAPRGMPVEVIVSQDGWSKVRDASGDLSWMQTRALTAARHVVVTAPSVKIHAAAADTSAVVATADRNVLLELAAPVSSGWVKVRHQDGTSGFVKAGEVWGE